METLEKNHAYAVDWFMPRIVNSSKKEKINEEANKEILVEAEEVQ